MKTRLFALIISAGILLSACSVFPLAGDPLDGSAWELSSLHGKRLVEGVIVSIEFKDGQLGGSGGCNSYGGAYEVDGERIRVKELVSTLMACANPSVTDQESAYLQSLGDAHRFELADGQLQIYQSGGEVLTFIPAR